jgi:uncharacterized Fe-S cluster protein YjdI
MKKFIKYLFSTKKRGLISIAIILAVLASIFLFSRYHYHYKTRNEVYIFNLQPQKGLVGGTNCVTGETEAFRVDRSPWHGVFDTENRKISYSASNFCEVSIAGTFRDNIFVKRTRNIVKSKECGTDRIYEICKAYIRD